MKKTTIWLLVVLVVLVVGGGVYTLLKNRASADVSSSLGAPGYLPMNMIVQGTALTGIAAGQTANYNFKVKVRTPGDSRDQILLVAVDNNASIDYRYRNSVQANYMDVSGTSGLESLKSNGITVGDRVTVEGTLIRNIKTLPEKNVLITGRSLLITQMSQPPRDTTQDKNAVQDGARSSSGTPGILPFKMIISGTVARGIERGQSANYNMVVNVREPGGTTDIPLNVSISNNGSSAYRTNSTSAIWNYINVSGTLGLLNIQANGIKVGSKVTLQGTLVYDMHTLPSVYTVFTADDVLVIQD